MFGAPFPGTSLVTATLTDTTNSATSGAFTLPSARSLVVLCFAAQTSPASGVTGCTIGGHAATQIVNNGAVTNTCSMWAAMVDPTDTNAWSVTGITVSSGRCTAFLYRLTASSINATATATSAASHPTATLSVASGSSYIGCAKAQGASSPTVAWSLLSGDDTESFGQQSDTCAHLDYVDAAVSQTATCVFTGSTASAGVFAVFSP